MLKNWITEVDTKLFSYSPDIHYISLDGIVSTVNLLWYDEALIVPVRVNGKTVAIHRKNNYIREFQFNQRNRTGWAFPAIQRTRKPRLLGEAKSG